MTEVLFAVLDRQQRVLPIELSIRRDTVECRCRGRWIAVFDREALAAWLETPCGRLSADDMTWGATGQGVAVTITTDLPWQEVRPRVLEVLRDELREPVGI